jgi:RNA polymerase sigma factor (TIGR02999 family)
LSKEVTQLLLQWREGDSSARDELLSLVYDELKQLARRRMQHERSNHTLQPTALVNELYLRIADQQPIQWNDRAHFFGIAAKLLRQILVDHARSAYADKRGGQFLRITLDDNVLRSDPREIDLVRLDDALIKLAELDFRQSEIVEQRFFGGLSIQETAQVTGLSPATVKREWAVARAWLYREIASTTK